GADPGECLLTVNPPIAVTCVQVSPTSLTMNVGDTEPLFATVYPCDATNKQVIWSSSNENVAHVNAFTGVVIANMAGEATITATTVDGGYTASYTVTVNYCGGANYRDVTNHSLVLQDDGYYVCSTCGYRIKSPALQDKNILSDEDYYKVLSCYMSIPYYSKIDGEDEGNYSIKATALRLIIDDIRSKSQYSQKYEYVGSNGVYEREYTVGNENDSYYMPVTINYNVIDDGLELTLNNGIAVGLVELLMGWKIPSQYQFLFLDLADEYANITDFLCELAEKVGYKEISIILKLILLGSSINEMAVTDKVVKIQFSVGSGVYESKTVFDSNGNLKFEEHST
ncbi:MAG: Ig domain-containing protein, partial [Oscillospiraceae bacterium]|nr:Ig domain-containing protein [Oscillospiraceae bacterium]